MMRRRGIGLVGAAAVGGAAYHRGRVNAENAAREEEQQAQIADLQQQQAMQQPPGYGQQPGYPPPAAPPPQYAPPAPAPAAGGADIAGQLQQLANLKAQGILSDAEFEAAKAKLIGG
jgi:hypothetical protein